METQNNNIVENNQEEPKKKKKKRWLILLLLLLALLTTSGIIIRNHFTHEGIAEVSNSLPSRDGTKKMSDKDMKVYADKKVNASQVTLEVYPEIAIKDDGINGRLWVHNVPTNKVGQQAFIMDETGGVIAQTGLIAPGYEVNEIKLDKAMSKGDHKVSIRLKFFDLEKEKEVGSTVVSAVLKVGA